MWLFTRHGFYSVVVSSEDENKYLVRARDESHLENLIEFCVLEDAEATVHVSANTDYPCRLVVDAMTWSGTIVVMLVEDVDYTNFKTEAAKSLRDPGYNSALHDVWERMRKLTT